MVGQDKEIIKLENLEEYKKWISNQDWYQTIHLKNGLSTIGKLNTDTRIDWFNQFDFLDPYQTCWLGIKWIHDQL